MIGLSVDPARTTGGDESRTFRLLVAMSVTILVVLNSLPVVMKAGGTVAALIYAGLGGGLCFLLLYRLDAYQAVLRAVVRKPRLTFGVAIVMVVIIFAVGYPLADSGTWGPGSDGDDAINIGTTRLLHGLYPYSVTTYLGHPVSPMPGSLILSVPFVVLGLGAFQNVAWIAIVGILLGRRHGYLLPLALLLHLLATAPEVTRLIITGGDYIANTAYVLIAGIILARGESRPTPGWKGFAIAAVWGVTLSSRANFLPLVPMVLIGVARRQGWLRALYLGVTTGLSFLLVTAPFYLVAPDRFSPLHTATKLSVATDIFPEPTITVPLMMILVGVLIAIVSDTLRGNTLLLGSAAVLMPPLVAVLAGAAVGAHGFSECLRYLVFGAFPMFPAITGYYLSVWRSSPGEPTFV